MNKCLSILCALLFSTPLLAAELLSDPTRPAISSAQAVDDETETTEKEALILNYLRISSSGSIAIINDQTVHQGAQVNGHKVVEISTEGVLMMDHEGRQYRLSLRQPNFSKSTFKK